MNAPFLLLQSVILSYLIKGRLFFFPKLSHGVGRARYPVFYSLFFVCILHNPHELLPLIGAYICSRVNIKNRTKKKF